MYITSFDDDENKGQIKYLENYKINTRLLEVEETGLSDEYHPKTKKLYHFLKTLNQKDIIYQPSSDDDVIDFIYNKLIVFNNLRSILFSQIQSILTNCQIVFQHGVPILMFFDNILSYDINKETRSVYQRFIKILKTCCEEGDFKNVKQQEKLIDILEIFFKSGIKGIMLSDDMTNTDYFYFDLTKCFPDFKFDFAENIINFNFSIKLEDITSSSQKMMEKTFILYQQEEYEKIFPMFDNIISHCRTNKLWTLLFISMLNKNIIIRHLKDYQYDRKYDNVKEYDLKSEYEKLPVEVQSIVSPIYNFLEFNDLYRLFFSVIKDLSTKEGHLETIKKGGMVYGSDGGKNFWQQENLLYFVINNKIMIENYAEYRDIHRKILSISLSLRIPIVFRRLLLVSSLGIKPFLLVGFILPSIR